MKLKNKLDHLDLDLAVEIIRDDIGYEAGQCIDENMAMASFLYEMKVACTFTFGEAVFIPPEAWSKRYYRVAHRDFCALMIGDGPDPFHCWLDVDGQVLDIAIGSWTQDLPEEYKCEYVYGNYHNGFRLRKRFDRYDIKDNVTSGHYHSYRKFKSPAKASKLVEDGEKFRTNITMYEDLGLGNIYRGTAQSYACLYMEQVQ